MPMSYEHAAVSADSIPRARFRMAQHIVDTYASETNKVAAVWHGFADTDLNYRPHARSSTVGDILRHQLLSERRFFAEFLGMPEPAPADILPPAVTVEAATDRFVALARARLPVLAKQSEPWWLGRVAFFDVERERVWVFWRRVLHTAHHRAQLAVYLRLLNRVVPPTYGPTADITWSGADPTRTVDAAGRR
jgi:uncharacterized damage-inducible protein DinB